MRLQKTTFVLGFLSTLLIPFAAYGGPGSKVVTVWEERPRFFTAGPGEEHSRFTRIVWYDRPRFFTRAEGEEHSRFYRLVSDRPRIFSKHRGCRTVAYAPLCATRSTFLTRFEENGCYRCKHVRRCRTGCERVAYVDPCACPSRGHVVTTRYSTEPMLGPTYWSGTFVMPPSPITNYRETVAQGSDLDSANSYGSDIHGNVTEPRRDSRFTLTSDAGSRTLDSLVANWPQESRTVALAMQTKYGKPDSMSNDQIIWRDLDPWAEIIAFKNGTPHAYPTPHNDVLAQSIYFDVDAAQLAELNDFRANVKADHSRGLLTARCKDEAMNFLALNLAHDILEGEKSVVEANSVLGEKARSGIASDEYMSGLRFDVGTEISGENMNVNTDSDIDVDRE